jgi:hypothetical protein
MESLGEASKSTKGFFKHVFNFDDESKGEMLNIVQYSILALIPLIILNKSMQKYVPEADEQKGSLEIVAEVIIQVIVIFIGILFIHRIIVYIPTYSGFEYPEFSVIFIILAVLLVVLSLQTKLGEKITIICDRITELWEGKLNTNSKNNANSKKTNSQGNVKVSQPISQNILPPSLPTQQSSNSSYSDGTSISNLPNYNSVSNYNNNNNNNYSTSPQPSPNFNNMYQQDNTSLVNASTPGEGYENGGGIMAANEALGGSGFSTW